MAQINTGDIKTDIEEEVSEKLKKKSRNSGIIPYGRIENNKEINKQKK